VFEEIQRQIILKFLHCHWSRNGEFFCNDICGVCSNSALYKMRHAESEMACWKLLLCISDSG